MNNFGLEIAWDGNSIGSSDEPIPTADSPNLLIVQVTVTANPNPLHLGLVGVVVDALPRLSIVLTSSSLVQLHKRETIEGIESVRSRKHLED